MRKLSPNIGQAAGKVQVQIGQRGIQNGQIPGR